MLYFRSGSSHTKIDWIVLQNKEDIAEFEIISFNNKLDERNYSKIVPYNLRSQTIRNENIKVR